MSLDNTESNTWKKTIMCQLFILQWNIRTHLCPLINHRNLFVSYLICVKTVFLYFMCPSHHFWDKVWQFTLNSVSVSHPGQQTCPRGAGATTIKAPGYGILRTLLPARLHLLPPQSSVLWESGGTDRACSGWLADCNKMELQLFKGWGIQCLWILTSEYYFWQEC